MAIDAEKLIEDCFAAWNSHDVDKILSFYTDDYIYEDVAFGNVTRGKKELISYINSILADFPDLKYEMKSAFGTDDYIGCEWVMTGTQAHSNLPGIPATGKKLSIRGASIIELRQGKISLETGYWNLASMLQQLGLMPTPTQ